MSNRISAALERAKKMIAEDAQADSHVLKARELNRNNPKNYKGQPNDIYSKITSMTEIGEENDQPAINESYEENDYDNGKLDAAYDSMTENLLESVRSNKQQMVPRGNNFNSSKLPKEILKSLSENYIDESQLDYRRNLTLEAAQQELIKENAEQVNRQAQRQQVVVPQPSVNVDYSLIKTIVEDCMKKYAGAIVKKVLNENVNGGGGDTLRGIRIGDTFSFITSSGDLYEAELKFKKNINKKK